VEVFNQKKHPFGKEPDAVVVRIVEQLADRRGSALDLGVGSGPDAIFLARQGFTVKAVDTNPVALQQLVEFISEAGVEDSIEPILGDLQSLTKTLNPDSVLITVIAFVLHFILKEEIEVLLQEIYSATQRGGKAYFGGFLNSGEFDASERKGWWPRDEAELRKMFNAWDIEIEYEQHLYSRDGIKYHQKTFHILATKL
jgi:ubiquinone/menaquinone biosynthesis C-methylase UbiE